MQLNQTFYNFLRKCVIEFLNVGRTLMASNNFNKVLTRITKCRENCHDLYINQISAHEKIRTSTTLTVTGPSSQRVYQFRHVRILKCFSLVRLQI